MVNKNKNREKMEEKEIKKKIKELKEQLTKKQQKKVVVDSFTLGAVLYLLILIVVASVLENILTISDPSATILSIIGSLTLWFGVSWIIMIIIKLILLKGGK